MDQMTVNNCLAVLKIIISRIQKIVGAEAFSFGFGFVSKVDLEVKD